MKKLLTPLTPLFFSLLAVPALAAADDSKKCLRAIGVKADKDAFLLCKKAAEGGDPGAQVVVGSMYFSGQGVAMDRKEAHIWFLLAAESNVPGAKEFVTLTETLLSDDQAAKAEKEAARLLKGFGVQ